MSIRGIGVDIIEVHRIRSVIQRNKAFLKRVFTDKEIAYCSGKKNKWQHYAVRFAAKEAVWKAFGQQGIELKNIGIKNKLDGRPEVVLAGKWKKEEKNFKISLSHCKEYAVAQAIWEK
ncbi:MAG: holo-ACP synthase [Elusimicrobiota bacterium]